MYFQGNHLFNPRYSEKIWPKAYFISICHLFIFYYFPTYDYFKFRNSLLNKIWVVHSGLLQSIAFMWKFYYTSIKRKAITLVSNVRIRVSHSCVLIKICRSAEKLYPTLTKTLKTLKNSSRSISIGCAMFSKTEENFIVYTDMMARHTFSQSFLR